MASSRIVSDARARIGEGKFPTIRAGVEAAAAQRARSRSVAVDPRSVFFHAGGVDLGGGLTVGRLTDWASRQVFSVAGVPAGLADRLRPETRARVLNETWPRGSDPRSSDGEAWLVEEVEGGGLQGRAVTSRRYSRVWDADLWGEVERWLAPAGWDAAYPERFHGGVPVAERERALFRSDRESFGFFMGPRDPSRPILNDDSGGGWDDDGLGGMRRMLYVGNSETGARPLIWGEGWFRGVCCNFLVWGMEAVTERRRRHVGAVVREVAHLRTWIRDRVPLVTEADLVPFRVLAERTFPVPAAEEPRESWGDRIARGLRGFAPSIPLAVGRKAAALVLQGDPGAPRGSWWAAVQGVTAAAREETAGERFDLGTAAGRLVTAGLQAAGFRS